MLGAIDWGFRVILVQDALCSSADETHDAMMDIYMSRFGEQVETVTTETLLENWHRAAGQNLMTIGPSHLVQILLPTESGNGQPIRRDWFDAFLEELTDKFGEQQAFCGLRHRQSAGGREPKTFSRRRRYDGIIGCPR